MLAAAFDVSHERVALIPTVMQAGYAVGLVFLCPLGDLVRRRPFVLLLVWLTGTAWLGLCLTSHFGVFVALSFVTSVTTVTPVCQSMDVYSMPISIHGCLCPCQCLLTHAHKQVMLPLVGDLAPAHRRATALSVVVSGLLLGLLIARVLSGIIAQYSAWRNVYWMSFGLQYLIVVLLWLFMPDYPQTNTDITYARILWSVVELAVTTPLLAQACLVGFFIAATFTSFWTTLTFLLAGPPFAYSTVAIGAFAWAGIVPMAAGPVYSRFVTDRFAPYFSVVLGLLVCLVGIATGTYVVVGVGASSSAVAGPIIQAVLLDFGQQVAQVANRAAIYAVAPRARNRVNTAYMLAVFCGQLTGTALGSKLFARGGWLWSGSASVACILLALAVCLVRGPRETRWLGWRGGFALHPPAAAAAAAPAASDVGLVEVVAK